MKKTIAILLIAIMLTGIMVSCGKEEENSDTSQTSSDENVSSADESSKTDEPQVYGEDIPVKDLNGRTFRVLCRDFGSGTTSILGFNGEVIQREDFDETTAGIVDIAKYETRKLIEERYNCFIKGDLLTESEAVFQKLIRDSVTGDLDNSYDIYFDGWGVSSVLVGEGYLMDINSIETIDLTNPWWDQGSKNDMSINGKSFWMTGDINTYDNDGTWVILYNKTMMDKYHTGLDIYDIVEKGEWTLDKLKILASEVTNDTNDDGVMDEFDTWGFVSEAYSVFFHLLASGQRITAKDENDLPVFTFREESTVNVIMPILQYYLDELNVMVADTAKYTSKGYPNVWEATTIKAFSEGRALFFCCGLINLMGFRDLEFKYGILPMPKASAEQDSYYHSGPRGNMSAMCIPSLYADIKDYNDLGLIIEALGAESKNSVTPIYYEKSLKGRDAESLEDERMLDIIFGTRIYDLASPYNWGGVMTQLVDVRDANIASRFEAIASAAQTALDDFIELVLENN